MLQVLPNRNAVISALFDAEFDQLNPMRVVRKDVRVADDDEKAAGASH